VIRPEEMLICKIFEQTIEDYTELKTKNLTSQNGNTGHCSIREIENFFDSNWCSFLLEMINFGLSGKEILEKIKANTALKI